MPEFKIQTLSEQEAIDQIVETVEQSDEGRAPFALVLGSGFSQGLVPTARELVSESLPLWMKSLKDKGSFESQKELSAESRAEIAREFWRNFVKQNENRKLVLGLTLRQVYPRCIPTPTKPFLHRLTGERSASRPRPGGSKGP